MNVERNSPIETKRELPYKSLMRASNQIQVFIGDRIGNPAERAFLAKIVETLKHSRQPATLLANFQCGGRQIDCVVAMESGIALFEIKASTAPVKGEINHVGMAKEKRPGICVHIEARHFVDGRVLCPVSAFHERHEIRVCLAGQIGGPAIGRFEYLAVLLL